MTFRRVQETAAGTLFSALTHFVLLMLLAGWARHATIETPPLPLAVALWTPSEEVRPERKEAPVPRAGVFRPIPLSSPVKISRAGPPIVSFAPTGTCSSTRFTLPR